MVFLGFGDHYRYKQMVLKDYEEKENQMDIDISQMSLEDIEDLKKQLEEQEKDIKIRKLEEQVEKAKESVSFYKREYIGVLNLFEGFLLTVKTDLEKVIPDGFEKQRVVNLIETNIKKVQQWKKG